MLNKILNEKITKLTKNDYIILGIIILLYSILSIYNLGSTKNPQTFYTFKEDESIVFKFDEDKNLSRIRIYSGRIKGDYDIYASNDGKKYDFVQSINVNSPFYWQEKKILLSSNYIKLVSKTKESCLGDVSFLNGNLEIIKPTNIMSDTENNDNIEFLNDEKEMVPSTISYMNSTYFDEIYFARSAYEYIHNLPVNEWVHPPLGKLIQAIPVFLSNTMAPFQYRLMGNLAGIAMIFVMYLLGKELFEKRKFAITSALLMTFDCFHFAQTRMGTVDSFLVLFIMLAFLFMFKYFNSKKQINLFYSGLFFGLASTVKWTGLYCGAGLAILFLYYVFKNKLVDLKLVLKCICFFIIIPLTIYTTSFLIAPNLISIQTNSIPNIIEDQKMIYEYHSTLTATHPFSSKWYTWPFTYKPVWYYSNQINSNYKQTITGIGNIAIWWVGIISYVYLIIKFIKHRNFNNFILILIPFIMLIPYAVIGRVMFLYHYFPVLPFIMLSIVAMFKGITQKYKSDISLYIYLSVVIFIFMLYYPIISGMTTSIHYIDRLKLLSSWIF